MILHGRRALAEYLGVSEPTAQRWMRDLEMPIMKTPRGRLMTSDTLVDSWILARGITQRRRTSGPRRDRITTRDPSP